jgi:hypothetical protein
MSNEEESVPPQGTKMLVHYTKALEYRTIHVDGIIGGPTPNGRCLVIDFFNERGSFPETTVHTIGENGILEYGVVDQQINARPGIWREIDFNAVLDLDTARSFYEWLGRNIAALERQQKENAVVLKDFTPKTKEG